MCRSSAQGGVDHAIAALAAGQFGVVTRAQLVAVGLGRRTIDRRLAAGRLHRLHAGVYAVGHHAPRREAAWLAAVLACGPGAVLSHRSAASLWTIREGEGPRPDVTVATRNGHERPGIVVHRSRLEPQDRTVHAGIPVTSPTRTLGDPRTNSIATISCALYVRRNSSAASTSTPPANCSPAAPHAPSTP